MKRILCFEVNEERNIFVSEWAKKRNVVVDVVPYKLTMETVNEVNGYDGVSISEAGKFDSKIFPVLKSFGIKQLAQRTTGYEGFDLRAASENEIIITNVANYSPESIAEFTVMLALQLIRKSKQLEKNVNNFDFRWIPEVRGSLIREMKIAVIGVGHIGFEVAKLFHALGATIYGYATHRREDAEAFLTYQDSIEEAVQFADIVTLHIPGRTKNYHLFNKDMFSKMKLGSYLINTSRGSLIDTEEMLAVLDHGKLSGVGLDVYENEANYIPGKYKSTEIVDLTFKRMLSHPRVLFYPHVAYYTDMSMKNMVYHALDAIIEIIDTGDSLMRVN